jgi:probable O-glycosylation ligase (exosortase A-associated)
MVFASSMLVFGAVNALRGPFYGLLFYLGVAYFRPELWVWGDQLQSLNLSLIVGVYVIAATVLFGERLSFGLPVWLIAIFCLHGLLATVMSPHYNWSIIWWQAFAKVAIISILIVGLVKTERRLQLTVLVIAFALGFEGVKQGWIYLILRPDEPNTNGLEVLGDNNGVAVGMLMLASLLLALFQTTKSMWVKAGFAFMTLGVVFRSLTTHSRGGLIAFCAMSIMYGLRSRHRLRAAVLVVSLGLLLLPLLPPQYWERMSTMSASDEDRDTSSAGRLHFWSVAQRIANDHPLLGVGTAGFEASYDEYDTTAGQYGTSRAVHSTWFGIMSEQGYVGLLMLIAIFVMAFRACGRVRAATRATAHGEYLFTMAGALQTALVTVAVGGAFLSYQYVEILWHFIALSFAMERIAVRAAAPEVVPAQGAVMTSHAFQTT